MSNSAYGVQFKRKIVLAQTVTTNGVGTYDENR